jgi:hypothetical protein
MAGFLEEQLGVQICLQFRRVEVPGAWEVRYSWISGASTFPTLSELGLERKVILGNQTRTYGMRIK